MKIGLILKEECKHVVTLDFTFISKRQQNSDQQGGHHATMATTSSLVTESVIMKW